MQVLKHRRRMVDCLPHSHSHPRLEYNLVRYLDLGSFTVVIDVLISRLFKNPFRACLQYVSPSLLTWDILPTICLFCCRILRKVLFCLLTVVIFRLREPYVSLPERVCVRMSRSDRLIVCIGNLKIGVEGVNPTICFGGRMRF